LSSSSDIFLYINDLYDLLDSKDIEVFGETWRAYEQTYGHAWVSLMERNFGVRVNEVPLYNNLRWLEHIFDRATEVDRAANFRSNQDVSEGLNLSIRYLINFSIDGGPQIEVDLRGANPSDTLNTEMTSKINAAAGFTFATLVVQDALLNFTSGTVGPTSSITFYPASSPDNDASALVLGLDPAFLPKTVPVFKYSFQLDDKFIVGIPALQDKIIDEKVTVHLVQNFDYEIEFGTGIISFSKPPPESMWAKDTLVNLETPYNNFGFLMDIYDSNTTAYLKAVKGLWFAFWTGPRPENIRASLYLLFGLPTASKPGVVSAVDNINSTISLLYDDKTTESFNIPSGLFAAVSRGNRVVSFQPLVTGITVQDKVNSPGFLEREVGRPGIVPFLTQYASRGTGPDTDETKALKTVEQNTYLPQIEVDTFINPDLNLGNVQTFLKNLQPKSRTYLFQVIVGNFNDLLAFDEFLGLAIDIDVTPNVDSNPNTAASQADLIDAETNPDTGIILDSEVFTLVDFIDVTVFSGVTQVDAFHA